MEFDDPHLFFENLYQPKSKKKFLSLFFFFFVFPFFFLFLSILHQGTLVGMSSLPAGWEEHKNEGKTYYYNRETGVTQWERPTSTPNTSNGAQQKNQPNALDELGSAIKHTDIKKLSRIIRMLNLINAGALMFAAILNLGILPSGSTTTNPETGETTTNSGSSFDLQSFTLSFYIVLFSLLLLFFELRTKKIEPFFRKNFGFIFSASGRASFIFFCGVLCFFLVVWKGYGIIVGVATIVNAVFNFYVICAHPDAHVLKDGFNEQGDMELQEVGGSPVPETKNTEPQNPFAPEAEV